MTNLICNGCDRPIPADGPITASEVLAAAKAVVRYSLDDFWARPGEHKLSIRGVTYTPQVISVSPQASYDDYGRQGQVDPISSIFFVGAEVFRKDGTADSYGEHSWDGDFRSVRPVEKTVLVYE